MRGQNHGTSARFLALRRRLDLMGYTDYLLGIDSAPLAQQMLEDLVADTETIREHRTEITRLQEHCMHLAEQIEPLECQNTQLTREVRQLHDRIMNLTQELIKKQNENTIIGFEMQAENRRLALLNQQAAQHCRELETINEKLKQQCQLSALRPAHMRIPELLIIDVQKVKASTSHASRSEPKHGSSGDYAFDSNIIDIELQTLRKEKEEAEKKCEEQMTRCSFLENDIRELTRVSSEVQRNREEEADIRVLRHQLEKQKQEIEKMTVQLRVARPSGAVRHRALSYMPPRVTVSIEELPVVFDETQPGETVDKEKAARLIAAKDQLIVRLNDTIVKMSADFAFVHDHIHEVIAQKEAVIRKFAPMLQEAPPPDILVDTEGIEALQREMEEMKALHGDDMQRKQEEIEQLQRLLDARVPQTSESECRTCILLQQRLSDIQKSSAEQIETLQSRITELESGTAPATNALGELEELRGLLNARQDELDACQQKLAESEKRGRSIPELEERYKASLEKLRTEQLAMRADLKKRLATNQILSDKLTEEQQRARELQEHLQRTREQLARAVELRNEPLPIVGRDPMATIQRLERELDGKRAETETYQKLLIEAKKQLSPLMENTIPRFQAQITNLQRQKDETNKKIQRLLQLGTWVQRSIARRDITPEQRAFFDIMQEIQNDCGFPS
jgi:DNA repair exonuclease SbcCD ATPase subunit